MSTLDRLGSKEDLSNETEKTIRDLNGQLRKLRFKECKLIKASNTGRSAVMVSPDIVDISAPSRDDETETVGISVIGQSGTMIRGPVGFSGTPSDIRIAGMWKFNDVLLSAAPSTILTPIPVLRFSLPFEVISNLAKSAGLLAIVGGAP